MKTIFIAGAGGYIGSKLSCFFLDKGYQVKAFDRFFFGHDVFGSYACHANLTIIHEDIRFVTTEHLAGCAVVIDFAGMSNDPSCDIDPVLSRNINRDGSILLATLAKQCGVRKYFFSSSSSVYGACQEALVSETSKVAPQSLYAQLKLEVEEELLQLNDESFSVTLFRTATCFGLSRRMRFDLAVNLMTLDALSKGRITITGGGNQWRPFIHIQDVCRIYYMALQLESQEIEGQIFNLGFDKYNYKITTLALLVKDVFPGTVIQYAPGDLERRSYKTSFSKLQSRFQCAPSKDIRDGILEIKDALLDGVISDSPQTRTAPYYRHLIEAERIVHTLSLNGKLLHI